MKLNDGLMASKLLKTKSTGRSDMEMFLREIGTESVRAICCSVLNGVCSMELCVCMCVCVSII